jgi:uncharacterized membrane protein (UPF0182 family)
MLLAPVAATVVVLLILLAAFSSKYTDLLWFREVGRSSGVSYTKVFSTVLRTKVLLFLLYAVVMAVIVGINVWVAYRLRPPFRPNSLEQQNLDRYRLAIEPHLRLILLGGMAFLGLMAGSQGAAHWQTWLLYLNRVPFGVRDEAFNRDISFFAFEYPFYRLVVGFLFSAIFFALLLSLVTHYLFGGVRLQYQGEKVTPAARAHLSVLLGALAALKAVFYLLDRWGLAFSTRGSVTGASYTDVTARLPVLTVLIFAAALCAVLFVANLRSRGWLLPGVAMSVLVLSSFVGGFVVPQLVQQLRVRPNELRYEAKYIERNIRATRAAYGIGDVEYTDYVAGATTSLAELNASGETLDNVRLLDPNKLKPTFEQLQEIRSYFGFARTLDIDRYEVDGTRQDYVVGVREIDLAGLSADRQGDWLNQHVLYTHGTGFVAVAADDVTSDGRPAFPPAESAAGKVFRVDQPRVYYGELAPAYSVVNSPSTGENDGLTDEQANYRYDGKGGVSLGGLRRLLYAIRFREPNLLISSAVGSQSKIMYIRNPRDRVEHVAPFLKLDSDPYPVAVGGRIQWVLDGYTTSAGYPYSQIKDLDEITRDTTTELRQGRQPAERINYIRNSVKATVDAFDGTVRLYTWDEQDPVLKAWKSVFPGIVLDKAEIGKVAGLEEHFRYPEDLFKVQRELIGSYHVTDTTTFFSGREEWEIPRDPAGARDATTRQLIEEDPQPPYYVMLDRPGGGGTEFSLTTPFVFRGKANLAAFASVSSEPEDYGKIRVLRVPLDLSVLGPGQAGNAFQSDERFSRDQTQFSGGGSQVVYGNLLTLPVGDNLLYVQPIYVQSRSGPTYPLLQKVLVGYGDQVGYANTFDEALRDAVTAVEQPGATPTPTTPPAATPTPGATTPPPVAVPGTLQEAVQEALAAEAAAQAALQQSPPDFAAYDAAQRRLRAALQRIAELTRTAATPSPASPTPAAAPTGG